MKLGSIFDLAVVGLAIGVVFMVFSFRLSIQGLKFESNRRHHSEASETNHIRAIAGSSGERKAKHVSLANIENRRVTGWLVDFMIGSSFSVFVDEIC